jgi:N-methylhydantoinase B
MDPVQTEIMKNRFAAMAEEASTVAMRTAHTTFVKQTQDFQVAVANLEGHFFAYPMLTGTQTSIGQTIEGLIRHFPFDELSPGDVLISNDPFNTGGLVTHQMDIHLAHPIFFNGELMCFAWSFIHASDIGGAVPGSISPELYECFQEGFRIRPTKLARAGVFNQDLVNIIKDNSRISDAIWGDLEATMSAMRLLDRRINELCAKVGVEVFRQGVEDVMAYAEMKARRAISKLKDGVYSFVDYIEGNSASEATHIFCRLTIEGDQAVIDYTGSSPQVHAAFNFYTGSRTHPYLCLGLTNYIQTVEPDIPRNGGLIRPMVNVAPLGSVMNAQFPAAMGNRWVTVVRCNDALLGCINQALPEGIVACGAGPTGIISCSWMDPASGRNRVAVVEPFSGGSGGRLECDGVDGTDTLGAHLKSTPIENVEVESPLIVRSHGLIPSRFGHGRYRGGASICIELECRGPEANITVRGLDRFLFQPWGIRGGTAGHHGEVTLVRADGLENIGRIKILAMKNREILRMVSPSGGGFGDPLDRLPEHVLQDVRDELLSEEESETIYKVVVRKRRLDEEATRRLRSSTRIHAKSISFAYGEARRAYEEVWPVDASLALASNIIALPFGVRRPALAEIRQHLETNGTAPDRAAVETAVAGAATRFGVSLLQKDTGSEKKPTAKIA